MSLFGDLFGLVGGGLAVNEAYQGLGKVGDNALTGAQDIGQAGLDQSQFKPYGITSGIGNARATTSGINYNLSPQQQALQNQLGQGASNFFAQAGQDTSGRETDIYNRMRAMQQPGEDRQRLALEERLQNQGRMGVRTSMFGGTPEQFSMDQAQAEARNQASLMAMQQGLQEQGQQANIGSMMMQGQYMPQAALLQQMQPAIQNQQLSQQAQQYGAGLFGEANMGGLEAKLGSRLGQANLMGQLGTGLMSGVMSGAGSGGLFDWIDNFFGAK